MNFKDKLFFISCLFAINNCDQYFSTIGTYVSIDDKIFFTDTTTTMFLTRHYPNTCTQSRLEDIQRATKCADVKPREIQEVYNALVSECNRVWQNEVKQLEMAIPQQRAKRQNVTIEREEKREKRELTTI